MTKQEFQHSLAVEFGGVSYGKNMGSVGISVSRDDIDLEVADNLFINSQVQCRIAADPNAGKDVQGQVKAFEDHEFVEFVANVHGFSVKADNIRATLSIPKSSLGEAQLARFAGRRGTCECTRVGTLHEDGESDNGQEDADD